MLILIFSEKIDIKFFLGFILGQATVFQFWTPDSLRWFGCGTPNGSLWTICIFVQFYIVIFLVHRLLHGKKAVWFCGLLAAGIAVALISGKAFGSSETIISKLYGETLIPYFYIFFIGCVTAEFKERLIGIAEKAWVPALIIYIICSIAGIRLVAYKYELVYCLLMAVVVLGFGNACRISFPAKDYSYGLYIYHMLVVNAMIMLGLTGKAVWALIAFVITLCLAVISSMITTAVYKRTAKERSEQK